MKELVVNPATDKALPDVLSFVEAELEQADCPVKTLHQVLIAVEEIFVNIAHYAYYPHIGNTTVGCAVERDPLRITIRFLDNGRPFNPLERELPDTGLALEDREIGGLGILVVRKSMTDVSYEYKDGLNILTIQKEL